MSKRRKRTAVEPQNGGADGGGEFLTGGVIEKYANDGSPRKAPSRREVLKRGLLGAAGLAAGAGLPGDADAKPAAQYPSSNTSWWNRQKPRGRNPHNPGNPPGNATNMTPPAACTASCTFTPLEPCTALCQTPGACSTDCLVLNDDPAHTLSNPCTPGCVTEGTELYCTGGC